MYDQNEGLVRLMPQVHGLPPADEQKDTSRDCDKGDNNNNNNNNNNNKLPKRWAFHCLCPKDMVSTYSLVHSALVNTCKF